MSARLQRSHIEAMVVALAALRPDFAAAASRRAMRSHLSPACVALLDAIVYEPSMAWTWLPNLAENEAQYDLCIAAQSMPMTELTFHSVTTLLALARGPLSGDVNAAQVRAA